MDKKLILSKIKLHYNLRHDADLARFLGIKPQTLSSWYSRNVFDIELLYAKCEEIDANFLLTGCGEMLRTKIVHNSQDTHVHIQSNTSKNTSKGNNQSLIQQGINVSGDNTVLDTSGYLQQIIQEKDERIKEKDERIKEKDERIRELMSEKDELKQIIDELKNK